MKKREDWRSAILQGPGRIEKVRTISKTLCFLVAKALVGSCHLSVLSPTNGRLGMEKPKMIDTKFAIKVTVGVAPMDIGRQLSIKKDTLLPELVFFPLP